jgi:hypothetical protein
MNNIEIWDINYNIDTSIIIEEFKKIQKRLFLLDTKKTTFSTLEQFIYNIAIFHFKKINLDINNNFIEFWFKETHNENSFHLDCDEIYRETYKTYLHPELSCVTYLNTHHTPTIITNINEESYKYKEFDDQNTIYISFPKDGKQITFKPDYYHGTANIFNNNNNNLNPRYIVAINLWKTKPLNIPLFNLIDHVLIDHVIINNDLITHIFECKETIKNIFVSKDILNYNFYENLLYNKLTSSCYIFEQFIKDENNGISYKFTYNNTIENNLIQDKLKNKYGDIIDDITSLTNKTTPIYYNRFLQRFLYNKIYSSDICRWIINESELYASQNGGWMTKRHDNYPTTDLPIQNIKNIFNFIIESFATITFKIKKSYNLHQDIKLNFIDVFIVKYKVSEQTYLELHEDGSFLSFQILLSDTTDFEGGGTYFDDGLIMTPEQGDLIIHSSKIKHSGLPITKGTRYLLVGFINIDLVYSYNHTTTTDPLTPGNPEG